MMHRGQQQQQYYQGSFYNNGNDDTSNYSQNQYTFVPHSNNYNHNIGRTAASKHNHTSKNRANTGGWYFESNDQYMNVVYQKCSQKYQSWLTNLRIGESGTYAIGDWTYSVTKIATTCIQQINNSTQTVRMLTYMYDDEVGGYNDNYGTNGVEKSRSSSQKSYMKSLFHNTMPESDYKILQMKKYILIHQPQKHNLIYTINY